MGTGLLMRNPLNGVCPIHQVPALFLLQLANWIKMIVVMLNIGATYLYCNISCSLLRLLVLLPLNFLLALFHHHPVTLLWLLIGFYALSEQTNYFMQACLYTHTQAHIYTHTCTHYKLLHCIQKSSNKALAPKFHLFCYFCLTAAPLNTLE